jgi:RecA/RadA recombinase
MTEDLEATVQQARAALAATRQRNPTIPEADFLSTGSTLLNLALANRTGGGLFKGGVYTFVGDSGSGKTWLGLSCLAEANANRHFSDYRLILDDVERGSLMDIGKFFGQSLEDRLEPPGGTLDDPVYSTTTQQFFYHVDDAAKSARGKNGKPFIYVLDSMAALTDDAEIDKFEDWKKAERAGKDTTGTMGMGKAKINSSFMRVVHNNFRDTGSILIILDQSRDKVPPTGFVPDYLKPKPGEKTHGGGKATTFYSQQKVWFSVQKHITKEVLGKNRELGVKARLHVEKTRVTGRDNTVTIPIYWSYGIDDVGGCVDYLVEEEKHWKAERGKIDAAELGLCLSREDLIGHIQDECLEGELRKVVGQVWQTILEACSVERKSRYE